jgi:hypothetical protein
MGLAFLMNESRRTAWAGGLAAFERLASIRFDSMVEANHKRRDRFSAITLPE